MFSYCLAIPFLPVHLRGQHNHVYFSCQKRVHHIPAAPPGGESIQDPDVDEKILPFTFLNIKLKQCNAMFQFKRTGNMHDTVVDLKNDRFRWAVSKQTYKSTYTGRILANTSQKVKSTTRMRKAQSIVHVTSQPMRHRHAPHKLLFR